MTRLVRALVVLLLLVAGCGALNDALEPTTTTTSTTTTTTTTTTTSTTWPSDVENVPATVTRIVDGDTLDVVLRAGIAGWDAGDTGVRVRLLWVDTPEVYGGVDCYGREASARTRELVPAGTGVWLSPDPASELVDRYGRLLVYVDHRGGDLGAQLLASGHARVWDGTDPDGERVDRYETIEADAAAAGAGLWGEC